MTDAAFLARTPLLARDGKFGAYRLRAVGAASAALYASVFRAPPVAANVPLLLDDVPAASLPAGLPDSKRFVVTVAGTAAPDHISALKQKGFSVCARAEVTATPVGGLLSPSDYVWWGEGHKNARAAAAKASQRIPCKRIAGAIADRDAFEDAKEFGAHLFEGTWYLTVQASAARNVAPAQAVILELIRLTQAEAPVAQIEQCLKRDPTLSFRLLRYINSAGFGLSCEIQSFRHAVSILGYQNLNRWLALLLATAGSSAAAPALMREAIVRARLAELIGLELFESHDRDNLFIVGVFSLLPPILQIPMPKLLDQLSLAENISDALQHREGLYGPVLRLVEALESADAATIDALTRSLHLTADQLNAHHLEALSWADRVTL